MKKFYALILLFMAFITTGLAQTAVTNLSQLSNDKVYTLRSARCFLLYSNKVPGEICSSNGTSVGSVTHNPADKNQQFRIEKDGDNYYLYSVGAGKYVSSNGSYATSKSAVLNLENVGGSYPWKLTLGGNGMNSQESGQFAAGIVVNGWTDTDAGNCYLIEEVVQSFSVTVLGTTEPSAGFVYDGKEYKNGDNLSTDNAISKNDLNAIPVNGMHSVVNIDGSSIFVSYFSNSTKFYIVRNHSDGNYMSLNPDYCNGANLKLTNRNMPQDNRGLWYFEAQSDGGYKIYNYSTGLAKVLGMTGSGADARASMVDPNETSHSIVFDGTINFNGEASFIKIKGSANNYWNKRDDGNGGGHLALWNDAGAYGDNGSSFFLDEANYADYPDEYYYEVSNIQGIQEYTPENSNTLWYRTSAEAAGVSNPWQEYALPLGNGELGCMVFGGVHTEELQFNEKTLWSGPANTIGAGGGNRTFVNFGSLLIVNNDNSIQSGVTDYVRYLDLEEGIAGVEFKNGNGVKQVRKYFSSAPDSTIVGHYENENGEKLNLLFSLEPGEEIGASGVTYGNGTASFTGAMEAVKYAARLHVVADENAVITSSAKGITVSNATEVTFFLKGGTNFNGDMTVLDNYFTNEDQNDVNNRIKADLEAVELKDYQAIEDAHVADFTAITKRMTFDLGLETPKVDTKTLVDNYYPNNQDGNSAENDHLFLEQLYFHYGRYLAISSNRKPIAAPNNLQGIWNNLGRQASHGVWNSDIHTNINVQMNYWPTEVTNLSDLHMPFLNFIIRGAQSEGWKKVSQQYNNNGPGWSVLTESSLYNSMSTWGSNYLVANVWYTSHLWMHWRYTQDKEFLKKAFPVMWSCAEFWFHRMEKVNGEYLAPNEYSPEHGPGHNNTTGEDGTAHAQQMISYLFGNLMEAIEILDESEHGLTQEQIATLKDYYQNTDKGLATESCAASYNGVSVGTTLLREWKYSDHTSGELGHRHMSHLMALYPMEQITPESNFFEPAVNSLRHRGDAATGWSMGWKVNLWARAQDGDHAHIIIKNALQHAGGNGGVYYNLFDAHPPFQIDGNFGVCSGIAEMLMQSAHGYINILPALPKVWEKTGNVKGMKAVGNFTVDFSWQDGKCQYAKILSNAGAELKVRCNRGAKSLGEAWVTVNGVGMKVTVDSNNIATIPCKKNDIVIIDFTREAPAERYYELNVTEAEHATMYLGFDAVIPTTINGEGNGVYIVTGNNSTHAILEEVNGNVLPKETGVIVKATQGNHLFVQATENVAGISGNRLKGTLDAAYIDEQAYVLSMLQGEKVGFYLAEMNKDANGNKGTTHFLNNANKAYLPVGTSSDNGIMVTSLLFDFDDTTVIEEVELDKVGSATVYDLQGRRVNKITQKGMYVIDGKKVLVK